MSLAKVVNILGVVKPLLKGIRLWIISDGKFSKNRAMVLALFLLIIFLGIHLFGIDTMEQSIELLEEVSEVIGVID